MRVKTAQLCFFSLMRVLCFILLFFSVLVNVLCVTLYAGPVDGVSVASLPVCLQRLKLSVRDLHTNLESMP